jgi:hypothetical protein
MVGNDGMMIGFRTSWPTHYNDDFKMSSDYDPGLCLGIESIS